MQHSSNGEKRLSISHFFHLLTLQLAVRNALRYFPEELHSLLGPEFRQELQDYGHIYMYRLMPSLAIKAYPISHYPAKTRTAAAIMHMMMTNLDPRKLKNKWRNHATLLWPPCSFAYWTF